MRTWQKININLLTYAVENSLFKSICLYYLVKIKFHRHSIIYNYTPRRLARILDMHPKTVSRHVNKLINAGFCDLHCGNLLFRNQDKIAEDLGLGRGVKRIVQVRPWNTFEQIRLRLYNTLLKLNAAQQDFQIVVNHGYVNGKNLVKRELRKARKFREQKRFLNKLEENEDTASRFFSCRQLARLFNTSHTEANKIIHKLIRAKYIKAKERIEIWQKSVSIEEFLSIQKGLNENVPGFFYFRSGCVYRHRGREIEFLL